MTITLIMIGVFGTVTKALLKGLEDEWRPSKLRHYWERPEYREESWRLEENCYHSNSCERPSANAYVKNSQGVNNNNNNNNNKTTRLNWQEEMILPFYQTREWPINERKDTETPGSCQRWKSCRIWRYRWYNCSWCPNDRKKETGGILDQRKNRVYYGHNSYTGILLLRDSDGNQYFQNDFMVSPDPLFVCTNDYLSKVYY